MKRKERLGCGKHQFPNRDRRTASPLASPLQPMDHVFLRGPIPPKSRRPLLSSADHNASRFYGHRRKNRAARVFLRSPRIRCGKVGAISLRQFSPNFRGHSGRPFQGRAKRSAQPL